MSPARDGAIMVPGNPRRLAVQRRLLLDMLAARVHCRIYRREAQIVPGRLFRADLAWPAHRVAVELQGGVHIGGHHVRGTGYEADCEKILLAAAHGWRVVPLTWGMLARSINDIVAALDAAMACLDPHHTHPQGGIE